MNTAMINIILVSVYKKMFLSPPIPGQAPKKANGVRSLTPERRSTKKKEYETRVCNFLPKWKDHYPWVGYYSEEEDRMFCRMCQEFPTIVDI